MALLLALAPALALPAQEKQSPTVQDSRVEEAVLVLDQIQSIPESRIPEELFRRAWAVAVFPKVIKLGILIGGRYGEGVLCVQSGEDGWSDPVFLQVAGVSIGFQAGASSTDVILVFKNKESLDRILKEKATLGAGATVAAGPVGRHFEAATDVQLEAEIYSYSRSRGVFVGISLEGATLQVDDDANALYYGQPGVRPQDILQGKMKNAPASAAGLRQKLQRIIP
jgi:lipid-binding SYLF domain-containing protein